MHVHVLSFGLQTVWSERGRHVHDRGRRKLYDKTEESEEGESKENPEDTTTSFSFHAHDTGTIRTGWSYSRNYREMSIQ